MTNVFKSHPKLSWIAVSLVTIGGVITALELTNTTYLFHDKPVPYTASEYTKGEGTTDNTASGQKTDSSTTSSALEVDKTSTGSSSKLVKPTGNFVSSHFVSETSRISSTCNSTPGAVCQIQFTKGSTTKKLPMKTVDSGGAAYWAWQPDSIGLTKGTWQISVVATLGSQRSTANDALNLEVK